MKKAIVFAVAVLIGVSSVRSEEAPDRSEAESSLISLMVREQQVNFQRRLLEIQLYHPASPIWQSALRQRAVAKARDAASVAEDAVRKTENPAVSAAAMELADTRAVLDKMDAKIDAQRSMRKASTAVAEAAAALREAEGKDPRRAKESELRGQLNAAREVALADVAAAKPYLDELSRILSRRSVLEDERRGVEYALSVHRAALLADPDRELRRAQQQLADDEAAYEKLLEARTFVKLKRSVDAADENYTKQHNRLFAGRDDYAALTKREDALKTALAEQDALILRARSEKQVRPILEKVQELRHELAQIASEKRSIRIAVGGRDWHEIYWARGQTQRALDLSVRGVEKVFNAQRAAQASERAVAALLESKAATSRATAGLREVRDAAASEMETLRYEEAICRHHLFDRNSVIAAQVEASPAVAKVRTELEELRRAIRQEPPAGVAKAGKAVAEARTGLTKLRKELRDTDAYRAAAAAAKVAGVKLREARDADTLRQAAEDLGREAEMAIREAVGNERAAKELVAELEKLDKELEAIKDSRKLLQSMLK